MAELKEKFSDRRIEFELIVGEKGIFDVHLDGERLYCKQEIGRFPQYGEIPLAISMKLL
jgi:predicted Rdx family selenoprotein